MSTQKSIQITNTKKRRERKQESIIARVPTIKCHHQQLHRDLFIQSNQNKANLRREESETKPNNQLKKLRMRSLSMKTSSLNQQTVAMRSLKIKMFN